MDIPLNVLTSNSFYTFYPALISKLILDVCLNKNGGLSS